LEKCSQFGVEYVDHYIGKCGNGQNTRVKIKCPKHIDKGVYDMSWTKFRKSPHGCPYCSGKNKTTEDYALIINESIELLSDYRGLEYLIKCKCKECGYIWETKAANLKRSRGCPGCRYERMAAKRRKRTPDFQKELSAVNPDLQIVGEYKSCKSKTTFRCLKHNCEWQSIPSRVLNKTATCPECAAESFHEKMFLTNDEFVERLSRAMPNMVALEEYRGCREKISIMCTIHECIMRADPIHIMYGRVSCPECVGSLSTGERAVSEFLTANNIAYIPQATFNECRRINPLRFDFYIPSCNTIIEYDGEQHFYPVFPFDGTEEDRICCFNECKIRDEIKNKYCIENDIRLIRIPYWDYGNINQILEKEFVHT